MTESFINVTSHGVIGDGKTNNTAAIAEIISKLSALGGGTLYFPPGEYVTGSIVLKSNMAIYLEGGAVILASDNFDDFPMLTENEIPGYTRGGRTGIIAAINANCVTITGRGTIDGRGYNWWDAARNDHRPRSVQTILCDNVHISGITIINSPMWTVHPLCCTNVTIDKITIKNPSNSPNTDGINPESCSNVHISNCHIDVGDDCLTIKSGKEEDLLQKKHPCENITITNCTMLNGHGGVVIGSEMSGGVRNVVISNCIFNGTDRGVRIKTRRKRGGIVEDIRVNNLIMNNVFCPLTINGYYECGASPDDMSLFSLERLPIQQDTPIIKNISVCNVTARNTIASAGYLLGIPEMPVEGVTYDNVDIEMAAVDYEITEKPIMAAHVKAVKGEGFYCCNVKDVHFNNVRIKTQNAPEYNIIDSENVSINGKKLM